MKASEVSITNLFYHITMTRKFLSDAKSKLAALVGAGVLAGTPVNAGLITGENLVNQDGAGFSGVSNEGNLSYSVEAANLDPNKFQVNFSYTNPFTSADADSGKLELSDLHNGLISISSYGDLNTLFGSSDYTTNIEGPPTGEVDTGWSAISVLNGIDLTNNGVAYDQWRPTGQDASKDLFYVTLNLDKSLFDGNGNGWLQTDVDAGLDYFITKDSLSSLLGTANEGGALGLTSNETGNGLVVGQYVAIPEPGTLALVGLGGLALGAGLYGRKRKGEEN